MNQKAEMVIKRKVVDAHLNSLLEKNPAIYAVLLSSIDGHAIANSCKDELSHSKLSAMTSSCLALGEKIAVEAKQNGCDFVIIQNQNGYAVLKRLGRRLVISTLANKSINLGMLLSSTQLTAEQMISEIGLQ